MNMQYQSSDPESWRADAVMVFCREGENPIESFPELDKACPWLAIAPALRDFHGKDNEEVFVYGHPELKLPRALLIGLGGQEDFSLETARLAAARAARACQKYQLASAILPEAALARLPGGVSRLVKECVYGFLLGLYKFDAFKTKDKENTKIGTLFIASDNEENCAKAAKKGQTAAKAVCMARYLENLPGNMLYPETMALRAADLAQKHNLDCKILDEKDLAQIGAGCILAVGQGSTHTPRLIALEYAPEGCAREKPLILVGKGITFDSGGLCLKPAANMGQMKCDMSGAAAVLSCICAAAEEGIKRRIVAILACAENMPDGHAYRPGDILTALNGENVEVVNTDAEGRLVLADALTYAQKSWTPAAIVDIATLTGACAVALGNDLGGLFANDDDLAAQILSLGHAAGENFWRLPLWEKYKKSLKSEVADIKHTGAREGGAITAALFLNNFITQGQLWAHMDIAGVDWNGKNTPLCPEGATGFGTRTLLELARGGLA